METLSETNNVLNITKKKAMRWAQQMNPLIQCTAVTELLIHTACDPKSSNCVQLRRELPFHAKDIQRWHIKPDHQVLYIYSSNYGPSCFKSPHQQELYASIFDLRIQASLSRWLQCLFYRSTPRLICSNVLIFAT